MAFGFDRAPALDDPTVGRHRARRGDAAVGGGLGLAVLLLAVLRRRGRWLAVGALVLVAADLAWAGVGYNPAIDRAVGACSRPRARSASCNARRPQRFVSTGNITENAIPMDYKIPEARGYDLPVEERFDRLWRSKLSPEFPSQVGPLPAFIPLVLPKVDEDRLRYLSFLGRQPRAAARDRPAAAHGGAADGLRPPGRADLRQRRRTSAGVRRRARSGASTTPTRRSRRRSSTRARRAIVESGVSEGSPGSPARRRSCTPRTTARSSRPAPPGPGMLVVTESWAPGWHAVMGGEELKVERVDYLYRGVRVPAGTHIVEFTYRPLSWRIGWIVSLVAFVALLGGLLWRPAR